MADSYTTIQARYLDNADYADSTSVTKAKLFRQACRQLLVFANSSSKEDGSMSFDLGVVRAELNQVEAFIKTNDTTAARLSTRFFSMENMRE